MPRKKAEIVESNVVPFSAIVRPTASAEEAKKAWQEYQDLKAAILEPADIQIIQGRNFPKKSYWRKVGKFFSLSVDLVKEEERPVQILINKFSRKTEDYPVEAELKFDESTQMIRIGFAFSAYYRATAKNGDSMIGDGHCTTWEKGYPNSYHNAKATAHTRAKNRAISDLVGGGEVSAEEINEPVAPVQPYQEPPETRQTGPDQKPKTENKTQPTEKITEGQGKLIKKLIKCHVFSDDERQKAESFANNPANSKKRATEFITRLRGLIKERKKAEAEEASKKDDARILLSCIHCEKETCKRCDLLNSLEIDLDQCFDGSDLTSDQWETVKNWPYTDDTLGLDHNAVICKCGKIWINNYSAGRLQSGSRVCPWKEVHKEFGKEVIHVCPECDAKDIQKAELVKVLNKIFDYHGFSETTKEDFIASAEKETGLNRESGEFIVELTKDFTVYLEKWGKEP